MSNLFRRPRREVNKITDADLGEISAVRGPAQPKASWLVKSRDGTTTQLGFHPLHIAKGSIADGSWPDEDPLDPDDDSNPATDPDMDFTGRVARKRKKSMKKFLKKMIRKAVDASDGQSGGRSFSGSDRPGTSQDTRSPDEHADDTFAILRTMEADPPTAAENWRDYSARIFSDAINGFTSDELNAAKAAFEEIRRSARIEKSAGDTLNQVAFALKLAHPELSTQQAFAKASREHPELYAASRGIAKDNPVITGTIANGAIDQFESPRKARTVRKDQRADSTMNAGDPNVDDLSPEECNALIQREAQRIRQQFGTSATHALTMAAQRHPGAYMKSKDCPLG